VYKKRSICTVWTVCLQLTRRNASGATDRGATALSSKQLRASLAG